MASFEFIARDCYFNSRGVGGDRFQVLLHGPESLAGEAVDIELSFSYEYALAASDVLTLALPGFTGGSIGGLSAAERRRSFVTGAHMFAPYKAAAYMS